MSVTTRSLGTLTWATVILVAVEIGIAITLGVAGAAREPGHQRIRDANRTLARELGLTDLALSSGTSYTRHPSQADLFAPHNEHPAAIEHFPAGSVVQPRVAPGTEPPNAAAGAAP